MHFIRLIRPLNLLIIALTMYGLGWYFDPMEGCSCTYIVTELPFFLLVLSTVMIAAGGNIINDYFDVRADRINKPDRLIIGKHVKKRVAIVSHWVLNLVAFSIAVYLSYKMQSFWYMFIHLFSINILWFYSLYFKRKFLTGNILVAALTAMVPVLVGIFFQQSMLTNPVSGFTIYYPFMDVRGVDIILHISLGLASFAFLLNLAREIVKDIEDIEGDKLLKATTIPIKLGTVKSKWIIAIVLMLSISMSVYFGMRFSDFSLINLLPVLLAGLVALIAAFLLISAEKRPHYRRINHLIKLAMTIGLLTPVYWKILALYG
ncbi:MAG: 4-hydroxybenzoate polyprenyltransferase [Flavobacteriaceae bacterium]|jgi:4-hydroxybenzoate polyprenyltransferase